MDNRTRKKRISASYRYCFSGLVMQLWLYCEEKLDGRLLSREQEEAESAFTGILRRFLNESGQRERQEAFEQLKVLRDQMIKRMEILTAYSDCFQIYEYVLNRVERRFLVTEDSEYTPRKLTLALMDTMASMTDTAARNQWLRELIAQLPVRFTRKKFYAMVTERLTSYAGLDRGSVEDCLYMVKSSAMLSLPQGMEGEEELFLELECLRRADYKSLDRDGFERCAKALGKGSIILTEKTGYYLNLEQMINDLYVLFLTEGEKMTDAREEMHFCKSANKLLDGLDEGDRKFLEDESILTRMEGLQESVMEQMVAYGGQGDEILDKVERLVSGSYFMSVEPKEASHEEADRPWIEAESQKLCQEFDSLFAGAQKAVVRAVMAKTLSMLPVVFGSGREMEEYFCSSLESCTDSAELQASMDLLQQELGNQRLMNHVLV